MLLSITIRDCLFDYPNRNGSYDGRPFFPGSPQFAGALKHVVKNHVKRRAEKRRYNVSAERYAKSMKKVFQNLLYQ